MFETKLNKDLATYLAVCFGLLQFADILINRSLIPDGSIYFLLIITAIGLLFIVIRNFARPISAAEKTSSKINYKTLILIILLFAASISNIFFIGSANRIKKLNQQIIPQINTLIDNGNYFEAYTMLDDTTLIAENFPELFNSISALREIDSNPKNVKVYFSRNELDDNNEYFIGETPLTNTRLPRGVIKLRFEKEGYRDRIIITNFGWRVPFRSPNLSKVNSDKVILIDSSTVNIAIAGIVDADPKEINSYYIDENEIANKDYYEFLNSPYYEDSKFWNQLISKHKIINFSYNDIHDYVDNTGRKGPSTWYVGKYKNDEENFPVLGISWFEALAYCEFIGKSLPNIYQWDKSAGMASADAIIPGSNILKSTPVDINSKSVHGYYGLKHMAGNAREWIYNTSGDKDKFILGGGYKDEVYLFNWVQSTDPHDRTETNGCRCANQIDKGSIVGYEPIKRPSKDLSLLKPADNKTYELYRSQYSYDNFELNPRIIESKINNSGQRVERIEFDSFNNEKMQVLLYLPKDSKGPHKLIIWYPGSNTISQRSSQGIMNNLSKNRGFFIESGYALALPIFTSTFERGDGLLNSIPDPTINYRDHVITWGREMQITIDYLITRDDIDKENIAFFGTSWGGRLGGIMVAIEDRFKTAILMVGGMRVQNKKPEADPLHFLPRIKIPILMLNGRYDHFFPVETSQIPMYNFLGTDQKNKKHIIYDTGHYIPFNDLVNESLNWLQNYLK